VIGGSQGIGLEVVRQAVRSGYAVRALARSADRIPGSAPNLDKRVGSAIDADDVAAALPGVDAVVMTLGVRLGPETLLGPVRLFSAATRTVVPAMERAGIRRLICVTGFGAGDSRSAVGCVESIPFQLLLGRAYADKDLQERIIQDSRLDWTIVRPVLLVHGPRTGCYEALGSPQEWRNGIISRADVADFLVKQIDNKRWLRQSPVLRAHFPWPFPRERRLRALRPRDLRPDPS
jgi:uncharacterized protein YbjT (DUF2867 family)